MRIVAVLVALCLASCGEGPPPPPKPKPKPTPEKPAPSPFLKLRLRAQVQLRSSVLPPQLRDTGYAKDLGIHRITIEELNENEIRLSWDMKERFLVRGDVYDEKPLTGSVATRGWKDAREMILPVHWPGNAKKEFEGNALLWLTPAAYRELKEKGIATWRIGGIERRPGDADLRLIAATRGKLLVSNEERWYAVLLAASAAAEFRILDDPDNPLILSVKFKEGVVTREVESTTRRTRMTYDYEVTEAWIVE